MPSSSITTDNPDNDTMGGRLSRARNASGLSVSEVARSAAVRASTIESWEADRSEPRSNRLTILAGMYGVSPTWLMYGVGSAPQGDVVSDELRVLKGQLDRLSELHEQTGVAIANIGRAINRLALEEGGDL